MNALRSRLRRGLAAALLAGFSVPGFSVAGGIPFDQVAARAAVIVQAESSTLAAGAVRAAGGTVTAALDLVGGVAAEVPAVAVDTLRRKGLAVAPDGAAAVASSDFGVAATDVQLAALNPGPGWDGAAGAGVGVALVDTGVTDSPDLAGRLVRGPDLSGDADGLDHHGHGTFMAGLIAGDGSAGAGDAVRHAGVAPASHIVAVKIAGRDGVTSLSKMLEAIGWVVEQAEEQNIGVLNLSFGMDIPLAWAADPLSMAVEEAWASGITVVAAAGNDGEREVTSPGRDPWVITAGASDPHGTAATDDDTVPVWSGRQRRGPFTKPDVVAPGVSVVSLRAPGSLVDEMNPAARLGEAYFLGSGTSMAAALTSGAAAVLLADHPDAVPDDVKGALVSSSHPIAGSPAGAVDLSAAGAADSDPAWWQEHPLAGDEAGRPQRVPWSLDGLWSSSRWSSSRWSSSRWSSSRWSSSRWSSSRWSSSRWSSSRWSSSRWSSSRWSSSLWLGDSTEFDETAPDER